MFGDPHSTVASAFTTDKTRSAGRTAGAIKEILPVAEIMPRLVAEIQAALSRAVDFR